MLDEVVEGVFKFFGRFITQVFIDVIVELLIKGPGYLICRLFGKRDLNPDGSAAVITGLLFWIALAILVYVLYTTFG